MRILIDCPGWCNSGIFHGLSLKPKATQLLRPLPALLTIHEFSDHGEQPTTLLPKQRIKLFYLSIDGLSEKVKIL